MKEILSRIIGILIIMVLVTQNIVVFAANKTDLQNEQSEIDDKIDALKEEQEEIEKNKSAAMKAVEELIEKISDVQSEIDELQAKVDDLQTQIDTKEKDIQQKQEEYTKQEALLDARLIAMYESGETSYLDILLTSSSMTDFLAKYYAAAELIEYDKELIRSIKEQKAQIEAEKAEIEASKQEIDVALEEQKTKAAELKALKKDKESQVTKLTAEEKEAQAELEQFEKDKREIEAQLKKIAEEEAKKANYNNVSATPSACGYISPIPGTSSKSITCGYYGYSGHGGVDFGGHYGEAVVAVKAGTVVISTPKSGSIKNYDSKGNYIGSYSSYGEYIIINHHDGTMTLYAHGKPGSRLVKAGDKVKQGQQIMSVGNTGNVRPRPSSSNPKAGAHLHFEVRVNGVRVNPIPYLP